jgi:2'-5' RNA ligase
MASLPCNVVILPSNQLAEKAIVASKQLEPYGNLFTLEIGKYFPHASLYMLQLNEDDLDRVKELLAGVANEFHDLHLSAERFYQAQCYIDVEFAKNEQLVKLQQDVIAALNPVRDGMREKDKARMDEATGLALTNFQQYGYKYVGELFRPHITFTRFNEEQPDADKVLPSITSFDGTFTRIGLFEMGDNGTCVRQIGNWDLK